MPSSDNKPPEVVFNDGDNKFCRAKIYKLYGKATEAYYSNLHLNEELD